MSSNLKREYHRFLESEQWKHLKQEAFERDGFKCVYCGTRSHLHGRFVRYRKDLTKCTVSQVETACWRCIHRLHVENIEERRENRVLRRFVRILLVKYGVKPVWRKRVQREQKEQTKSP
jgi:5-methylcytosine-specific restriction endonuclease McrA